jgi:hypothetical protein
MNLNKGLTLVLVLVAMLFVASAFAQETGAGMQGVVKDSTGAVVPKATVEITSPVLVGKKEMKADDAGFFHFENLPAGEYTLTVTSAGFRTFKQTGIILETGHTPTLNVALTVGGSHETVEVSSEAQNIDVTQSKVQTNITADLLDNVPKGRSFQSVIQFAPGARTEPLQSSGTNLQGGRDYGYQIGGASNSENAYLVEGAETASTFDGSSAANVPMEFIQEVQVKTNGFEAEYGGALGGVVNVLGKHGTNRWHGDVMTIYSGSSFDASPNASLIRDPLTTANSTTRTDQAAIFYQPKKDHYRTVTPGFDIGGPIVKDRLNMFFAFSPEIYTLRRTVFMRSLNASRDFNQNQNRYYSNGRLDYTMTQKIRVYGSWTYQYTRLQGSSLPQADSAYGQYNSAAGNPADNYNSGLAYVYPNSLYNFGADISITPNIVSTTRYGWLKFDRGQSRGTPVGIRYLYVDTNYPYALGPSGTSATTSLTGTPLSSAFYGSNGYSNIGANTATLFDAWKTQTFNQDVAFFAKWLGTHNFKAGYGFRKGENNILSGYNTSDVYVAYATQYYPNTTGGIANCNAIIAQNLTNYGVAGGTVNSKCQGLWGTVNLRDLGTTGKVGGWNHSLYFQDAWTVGNGITLNVGVRMDKESLPTYDQSAGFKGIDFGWGQKVAPRLGASWDVFRNGKLKAYGSFGYFYDIMKYQLSRGSFGGDYWHDCVYALDTADYTQIVPVRDALGHYCPLGGGSVQANGNFPANGMRFIENYDYRQPSNDPNNYLIDPNLKPMKQHSMTLGADWAISPTLVFQAIYTRTRLDRTIEDTGIITPNGEQYYISNPGEGINRTVPTSECTTCPVNPKPMRRYDAFEFRLTRRANSGFNGSMSYTYSRLKGNYSGLTATDVSDSIGRNGANTDRAFDEPFMQFDAHGNVIDGPLATDRPNTFKAYGYYTLKYKRMSTMFGAYQQIYQGTPLTSYTSVEGAPVFLEGRGNYVTLTNTSGNFVSGGISAKRTPIYSDTDFNLAHEIHVSKSNENWLIRLEANVANVFNQHSPVIYNQNFVRTGTIHPTPCSTTPGCPATNQSGINYAAMETSPGYDYIATLNNAGLIKSSLYGLPMTWQTPRTMRFKVTFTF